MGGDCGRPLGDADRRGVVWLRTAYSVTTSFFVRHSSNPMVGWSSGLASSSSTASWYILSWPRNAGSPVINLHSTATTVATGRSAASLRYPPDRPRRASYPATTTHIPSSQLIFSNNALKPLVRRHGRVLAPERRPQSRMAGLAAIHGDLMGRTFSIGPAR